MTIQRTRLNIKPTVTQHSLIGTGPQRPVGHGNYFWFHEGRRCINMWKENLEHIVDHCIDDDQIEVDLYEDTKNGYKWVVVVDERIPEDFLNDSPCFTGYYSPGPETVSEMMYLYEWDQYKTLQYIDPKTYYEMRGGSYDPDTGVASFPVNPGRKETYKAYKMATQYDAAFYHVPYVPKS